MQGVYEVSRGSIKEEKGDEEKRRRKNKKAVDREG